MDRKTYGWESLNVCFWGKRLVRFTVGRLTMDIYKGSGRTFTCMGGGANGSARYWNLFWPLGSVMWIARKSNACVSDGPADAPELTRSAEGPFAARNG